MGQEEVWDHKQGDMHMVAAKLGCERAMVGTGYATSLHGQAYKAPLEDSEWAYHNWSADYCMLVNEWAYGLRSQVCILRLEVDLGSVIESEVVRKILGSPSVFVSRRRGAWEQDSIAIS